MKQPVLTDAASVIITRSSDMDGYEILLMKRNKEQRMFGGVHVFPGGRLDESDCDKGLSDFASGFSCENAREMLTEPEIDGAKACGLFFTALRETFEECGVLFAANESGDMLDLTDSRTSRHFYNFRQDIYNKKLTLAELALKESIFYSLTDLVPFARWVTPDVDGKRFDTRFFVAKMPEKQSPLHDPVEMSGCFWTTPGDALAAQEKGDIVLMPPTIKILDELSRNPSMDDLFRQATSRDIQPIHPQIVRKNDTVCVLLPNDPDYSLSDENKIYQPDAPSRIVMSGKVWKIMMAK